MGYSDFADAASVQSIYNVWRVPSIQIPRAGGILLNPKMDKVLLIRGTTSSSSWGFPRGKIGAKHETDLECATREIFEETGYDPRGQISWEDSIEVYIKHIRWRMFVVQNIEENTVFHPKYKGWCLHVVSSR